MTKKQLAAFLIVLFVTMPLALQRCGQGVDTDKTLKVGYFGASGGPSASPSFSGVFDPNKIADLKLWFDASYFSGLGLADGALISGGTVWGNIVDSTGATHVSLTTGTPYYYRTSGPNGTPAVQFNNTAYFSSAPAAGYDSAAGGMSVFVVGKILNTGGTLFAVSGGTGFSAVADDFVRLHSSAVSNLVFESNKTPSLISSAIVNGVDTSQSHIYVGIWNPASSGTELFVMAAPSETATNVWNPGSVLNLGGVIHLGWSGSIYLDGSISEVLVYKRAINVSEQALVMEYLKAKYKL